MKNIFSFFIRYPYLLNELPIYPPYYPRISIYPIKF